METPGRELITAKTARVCQDSQEEAVMRLPFCMVSMVIILTTETQGNMFRNTTMKNN